MCPAILPPMERSSGLWIASTPHRAWGIRRRPIVSRRSDVNLQLDGNVYQLWEGFGGGVSEMGWEALTSLRGSERVRALLALFNHEDGLGLHYGLLPVGASNTALDVYTHDDGPSDLRMKKFDAARDGTRLIPFIRTPLDRIRYFKTVACPWSPPEWMKEPARGGGTQLIWDPAILQAYAVYLSKFVEEYRREGIVINHLLVQNEPGSADRVPGCRWTGARLRDFIRDYLGPRFVQRRLTTKLWLGAIESESYEDPALTVLSDRLAMNFVAGVACRRRGRGTLARIRRAFPEVPLMLADINEGDGGNTWGQAHQTFGAMVRAIADGISVCLYDNMVFPVAGRDLEGRGRNSMVLVDPASQAFTLTPDYHAFRHFSCLTDRHSVRLGLVGEWADRAAVFFNESDESRVLVVQNPELEQRRVVLADRDRLLAMDLQPQSFNTLVL